MPSRAHITRPVVPGEATATRPDTRLAFWCLLAFTFVLCVAPQTFVPGLAQVNPARVIMLVGILAAVAGRLAAGEPVTVWRPESKLMLALWLWGGLSVIWSEWPGGSFAVLTDQFGKSVVLFFVIVSVVDSAARLRTLLASMAMWGALVAWTVIRNYVEGNVIGFGRVAGFESPLAGNPNDAALLLNLLIALSIGLFRTARTARGRFVIAAAIGTFVVAVIATFSRGGFIGLLVIGVLLALREWRRQRGLLLAVAGLGLLSGVLAPEGYGTRLISIYDFSRDETGSAGARWEGMIEGAKMILAEPLGVGLGQDVLGLQDRGLATWTHVHSLYLQMGADLGVVGVGLFGLLCWRLVVGLRRGLHDLEGAPHSEGLRALGRGVEMALVTFLVQATVYPVAYSFYFYYVAALSVVVQAMASRRLGGRSWRGRPVAMAPRG